MCMHQLIFIAIKLSFLASSTKLNLGNYLDKSIQHVIQLNKMESHIIMLVFCMHCTPQVIPVSSTGLPFSTAYFPITTRPSGYESSYVLSLPTACFIVLLQHT